MYRVLRVLTNSPAKQAGLIQGTDYIICFAKSNYNNFDDMIDKILKSA